MFFRENTKHFLGREGVGLVKANCEYPLHGRDSGSQTEVGRQWIGGRGRQI